MFLLQVIKLNSVLFDEKEMWGEKQQHLTVIMNRNSTSKYDNLLRFIVVSLLTGTKFGKK